VILALLTLAIPFLNQEISRLNELASGLSWTPVENASCPGQAKPVYGTIARTAIYTSRGTVEEIRQRLDNPAAEMTGLIDRNTWKTQNGYTVNTFQSAASTGFRYTINLTSMQGNATKVCVVLWHNRKKGS